MASQIRERSDPEGVSRTAPLPALAPANPKVHQ